MKTILLMTAVLVLAGCGDRKGTTSGADTAAMGPATTDTDTAMTRDTAH
jgi:outer membrane lipopolysaccharide assembly protein LptE/RlpB